jgi:hypothetical protein
MTRSLATTIAAYMLLAISPVLAQTTAPGSVGAGGATGTSGLADWWWIILVVIVIGAAIWYFTSRRNRV